MNNTMTIEYVNSLGIYIVLLEGNGGYRAYLHTDFVWRANCVGPKGLTGHWDSQVEAEQGVKTWLMRVPEYKTVYRRNKPERIVKVRKRT